MAHNSLETSTTHYFGVGLHSPKNGFNIGAAVRATGNFDGSFFVASGSRFSVSSEENKKSDFRNMDTEQTRKKIPTFIGVNSLLDFVPHDCELVCLERDPSATSIVDFVHPRRAFYVFGPEDGKLPEPILLSASHKVFIPTNGSLNLAHAVVATLCDRQVKMAKTDKEDVVCPACGNIYHKMVEGNRHCNACGHMWI
jgi:tRNA(Leu) C34 or U34 (ribose-2'-O)-methylase TrmL